MMSYNQPMQIPTIVPLRNTRLFDMAVYVTVVVLAIVSVLWLPESWARVPAVVVCLVYGLVYRFGFAAIRTFRQAVVYFVAQVLLLTVLVVLTRASDIFGLLFFILGIQAVLVLPNRVAILGIVLLYLIQSGVGLWSRFPEGIVNVVFNIAVYFLTYVWAKTLRQSEAARLENEQLLTELRQAQRQLHDLAVAEERNRLARDLHDSVKQQVFATLMQLGAARVLLPHEPQAAQVHVVEAEQLAQQAGAELSLLIHELRPLILSDKGLPEALQAYTRDWSRQTSIQAVIHTRGGRPLPSATEHALLRVAQEALANVARHSYATTVTIDLTYAPNKVTLIITDNGRGFDHSTTSHGVGLASMRERLERLGGHLQVQSKSGAGTRIFAQCGETYE